MVDMEHAAHTKARTHDLHSLAAESVDPWTSVGAYSKQLGVSRWTIVRAFHRGHIPGIKVGATYRLLAAFLDEVVALVHTGHGIDFEEFSAAWTERAKEAAA